MNKKSTLLVTSALLAAMLAIGCDSIHNTNGNHNANANANHNANASATAAANSNAGSARNANGNMSREEFERNKDSLSKQAKDLGRKIGTGAEDLWLWTKTRAALAAADDLRDSTVNVDVDNNVVTLSGTVASAAQKAKAEQVARGIEGVKSVKNTLAVSASGSNTNNNSRGNRNRNAR